MIIAWRKEAMGGFMTVASLVSFYLVYGYLLRNHIGGWFFLAFASPGFLFLFHWLLGCVTRRWPSFAASRLLMVRR